jgi:hypothetical protein
VLIEDDESENSDIEFESEQILKTTSISTPAVVVSMVRRRGSYVTYNSKHNENIYGG